MKIKPLNLVSLISGSLGLLVLFFYLAIPMDASEEYKYTIKCIYKYSFIPLIVVALVCCNALRNFLRWCARTRYMWAVFGLIAAACICVPLLSPPAADLELLNKNILSAFWVAGSLFMVLSVFMAAAKLNNLFSTILCFLGSLVFSFFCMEVYFLSTYQYEDAYRGDTAHSRYVAANQAQADFRETYYEKWIFPSKPAHPSAAAPDRAMWRDQVLYDVRYVFDDRGHRAMPSVSAQPKADILLFGCSFTFGHGLENDQTWPWKLSIDLGPDWRIDNYAYRAFGAQQMLDMLEDKFVTEPTAPFRQAFFLAILDHLRRFTGLFEFHSSRYVWKEGRAVRQGIVSESPYYFVNWLKKKLNGSQAAREFSNWLSQFILRVKHDEFMQIYISIIRQAEQILKNQYHTPLTVLIWPDFEELAPKLRDAGIKTLEVKNFLPDWDKTNGEGYHIAPTLESHPNSKATTEIAAGLASLLKEEYEKSDSGKK